MKRWTMLTMLTVLTAGCATMPDPEPVISDVDLSGYEVQGAFDFRHAKTTIETVSATIGAFGADSGPFAVLQLKTPTPWPDSDSCNGVVCAVWKNTGGYFDYVPTGATTHGWRLQHLIDGYGGPASGEDVGFFVMALDGSERSSVKFTTWP